MKRDKFEYIPVPEDVQKAFQDLAHQQRGEPEKAMLAIQYSEISALYGFVAEHTGDLIHRMSERIFHGQGQYGLVLEKVEKVLRTLTASPSRGRMRFEDDLAYSMNQLFEYYKKRGEHPEFTSPKVMLEKLMRLGQKYADAHRKLPTYNKVQIIAQSAAIAVGEFKFKEAVRWLRLLNNILKKGPQAWAIAATAY